MSAQQRHSYLATLAVAIAVLAASSSSPALVGPDDAAPVAEHAPSGQAQAPGPAPAPIAPEEFGNATAPSLDALVDEALARSPSVAALEAALASSQEMIRPAGALPDPMIEGNLQDVGFPHITIGGEEMSMAGVEIRQGLLFPGKRKARREAARAEASTRGSELAQLRRSLIAQVRGTYARLYSLDRERESLVSAHDLLEMLSSTVGSRYAAGKAEMEAVVKAQLSLQRLGERLDDLVAERETAVAVLNRLLDRPSGKGLGEVKELPEPVPPPQPWDDLAIANAPEVGVARARVGAAERRVQVAKLELKPNLSAGSGFASRGGLDPVVTLNLGMEFPLWRGEKQKPLVRAAELDVRMAEEELRAAQASARADAARLGAEWRRAEVQIRRFREGIVPQSSVALDAARASYQNGRGDFSTVVEDYNLWLDARVELARREAERLITWAELDSLVSPLTGGPERGETR